VNQYQVGQANAPAVGQQNLLASLEKYLIGAAESCAQNYGRLCGLRDRLLHPAPPATPGRGLDTPANGLVDSLQSRVKGLCITLEEMHQVISQLETL